MVCGMSEGGSSQAGRRSSASILPPPPALAGKLVRVLPYPGGRPPRDRVSTSARSNPMRGTKASIFLPWDPASYVVVDLPEAIFSNLGPDVLGAHPHSHGLERQEPDFGKHRLGAGRGRELEFAMDASEFCDLRGGHSAQGKCVEMELWLRNFSGADLTGMDASAGLPSQICVMLKGAPEFDA